MSVTQMIEVAVQEDRWDGDVLVILDGIRDGRAGVRWLIGIKASGYWSEVYDGQGRGYVVGGSDRDQTAIRAMNGYLDVLNDGI
jgi:hypothetical protein